MSSVVPEGWHYSEIQTLVKDYKGSIVDGPFGSNLKTSDYVETGVPVLQGKNVTNDRFMWSDVRYITKDKAKELSRSSVRVGDILMVKIGSVGYSAIVDNLNNFDFAIIPANLLKIDIDESKAVTNYVHHYMTSPEGKTRIVDAASSTAQPALSLGTMKKFRLPIPPLPEQKKIASILTSVDEVIENTQKQIDKLQDLKKATMNELLTKGIGHTEFKDSELGRIPKSWKEVSLGKLIDKLLDFRGRTPKKLGLDWGGGKIKALSANNVKMGRVDFEKECYLASNELYEKWMTKGDSRKDDVLFTMEAPLGNVCLVPDNNRYILSQRVILFRVNKLILPSYIHHTLASQYFQNTLVKHSTGTTATGIQQKNLVKLKLLVPSSIEEQQKIASIITSVDKKIEYIQKKLSQTQSLKKSLMQDLLTGKVRVTVN